MGALPQGGDVGDLSEPGDAGFAPPVRQLDLRNAAGIGGIGSAGEQQPALLVGGTHDPERGDEVAHALVVQHPADIGEGHRPVRLRDRAKAVGIDTGPGNDDDMVRLYAEFGEHVAVVGVLHQTDGAAAIEPEPQQQPDHAAHEARLAGRIDEGMAEAGDGIDIGGAPSERGHDPEHARLQRDMVHNRGGDGAVNLAQGHDGAETAEWRHPSAREADGMEREAFPPDGIGVVADIGGDMDLVAGGAGGARHRQPVRQEIPVFGHDIDEARRWPRSGIHPRWPPDLIHIPL